MKIETGYEFALGTLWETLTVSGAYQEAWELYKSINKNNTEMLKVIKQGYSEGGYKGALISGARLDELRFKTQYCNPTKIAGNYDVAGENDKAIYWLEKVYEVKDPNLPYFLIPSNDGLRNDPRFQKLARKMNLPYK
jgi:hypothetical protein